MNSYKAVVRAGFANKYELFHLADSDAWPSRIAAAQDRDFMVNAATCWVYVATAMRCRDDADFAEAMRQEKRKSFRAAQLVAGMIALANVRP